MRDEQLYSDKLDLFIRLRARVWHNIKLDWSLWLNIIIYMYHEFVDRIDNSSRGSLLGITRLCRVMPNSDPRGRIVYRIHKRIVWILFLAYF